MKYKTIRELVFAYEGHELNEKNCPLIISGDRTTVWDEDGVLVFEGGHPKDMLKDCLTLLGIPWDNA